jgi:hypothetical protein
MLAWEVTYLASSQRSNEFSTVHGFPLLLAYRNGRSGADRTPMMTPPRVTQHKMATQAPRREVPRRRRIQRTGNTPLGRSPFGVGAKTPHRRILIIYRLPQPIFPRAWQDAQPNKNFEELIIPWCRVSNRFKTFYSSFQPMHALV